MTIFRYQRIVSSPSSVVGGASAANAVSSLVTGSPAPLPVAAVSNSFPVWPQISRFDNDAVGANPQTIWLAPGVATSGQSAGFAAISNVFLLTLGLPVALSPNLVVAMSVFADNGVEARIQAFNFLGTAVPLVEIFPSNLNVPLKDGTVTDPNSENVATPPYGWQQVRFYSINTSGTFVGLGVQLVFSFEVLNYTTNGDANPGGLAFIADIYGDLPLVTPPG
jgi:hypothetical protein